MESLRQRIANMRQSLFDEGLVDDQRFQLLEKLQDAENPHLAEESFTMFFSEAPEMIAGMEQVVTKMEQAMEDIAENIRQFQSFLYKLEGCSLTIGAKKVNYAIMLTRDSIDDEDISDVGGVKVGLEHMKQEVAALEERLTPYFELLSKVNPKE